MINIKLDKEGLFQAHAIDACGKFTHARLYGHLEDGSPATVDVIVDEPIPINCPEAIEDAKIVSYNVIKVDKTVRCKQQKSAR